MQRRLTVSGFCRHSDEIRIAFQNGDHLSASEFLRRYQAMPGVKKAELIQGIVHMASPVRSEEHGKPDSILNTWLGVYAARHPGLRHRINTTLLLGPDDTPQPDGLLFREGGSCRVDASGYLSGTPDLVAGIAASRVFPGLRLDVPAALRFDAAAVLAALAP